MRRYRSSVKYQIYATRLFENLSENGWHYSKISPLVYGRYQHYQVALQSDYYYILMHYSLTFPKPIRYKELVEKMEKSLDCAAFYLTHELNDNLNKNETATSEAIDSASATTEAEKEHPQVTTKPNRFSYHLEIRISEPFKRDFEIAKNKIFHELATIDAVLQSMGASNACEKSGHIDNLNWYLFAGRPVLLAAAKAAALATEQNKIIKDAEAVKLPYWQGFSKGLLALSLGVIGIAVFRYFNWNSYFAFALMGYLVEATDFVKNRRFDALGRLLIGMLLFLGFVLGVLLQLDLVFSNNSQCFLAKLGVHLEFVAPENMQNKFVAYFYSEILGVLLALWRNQRHKYKHADLIKLD